MQLLTFAYFCAKQCVYFSYIFTFVVVRFLGSFGEFTVLGEQLKVAAI